MQARSHPCDLEPNGYSDVARRLEMRSPTRLLLLAFAAPILFAGTSAGADDEWSQCGPGFQVPERPAPEAAESGADPETIHLSADETEVVEGDVSKFFGNVIIEQGPRRLQTEELVYNQSENVIEASGGVRFWEDGLFVTGESARADFERNSLTIGPTATFILEKEHGHGDASEIGSSGTDLLSARDVSYTTCDPDDVDWRITASQVELDRVEDVGTAEDMWIEFKGRRVMYLPWISFPLSSRRKSGFLAPTFGISGYAGAEVTVPYYFNLAPNYDATIAARRMSGRGVQAQGEFRFLSDTYGHGQVAAYHIPHDSDFGDKRTATNLVHRHAWSDRWSTDIRSEWVSDTAYFEDLAADLTQSSQSYLARQFDARYQGDGWDALVRLQDFTTLDRTSEQPYARVPQILLESHFPERNRALNFDMTAEFAHFERESRTTGSRVDLRPSVTFPLHAPGVHVTPKAALHITEYNLDRTNAEAALDDSPSRVLPSFSLDGSLFLERPLSLHGKSLVHTIEPRIYYLLVPYDRQNQLPRFDTSATSFSFAQLFRENRYSGRDRIGDTNQLTLALTSRLLDDRGRELGRASVGQIRYFRDRRVTLGEGGQETTNASDLVAEIEARPTRDWGLRAGIQFDDDADRTDKGGLAVQYQPNRRSVINAAYRFVRDISPSGMIEQADLSFAWPLGANWRAVGRWNFALNDVRNRTLEAFAGLEYDSCCWGFNMIVRRFRRSGAGIEDEDRDTNGFFFQLELKGLTGTRNSTEALLARGIPGYENEF